MKILFLFLICVCGSISNVTAQSDIKLEIGAKLPRKYLSLEKGLIATHASQLRPFVEVTIGNVDYQIAFEKKTRKIKYIHTDDEDFRTVGGFSVDSEITFTREQLIIFPYWEIRAPAASDGWFPVIGFDISMQGKEFIEKLKAGEKATTEISGFSKGSN
ncbi:MAG: hypothetical protein M3384_06905 [Acidobacteriota bacterium]|nr:hypothetical protein [Acidobacteriota bacterium]